jgi:hypothetical protein
MSDATPPSGRRVREFGLTWRCFTESVKFLFPRISEASAVDKDLGRPPHLDNI